jgi:acetyl esterase/lipase
MMEVREKQGHTCARRPPSAALEICAKKQEIQGLYYGEEQNEVYPGLRPWPSLVSWSIMKRSLILTGIFTFFAALSFAQTDNAEILLWPQGAPGALGDRPQDKPSLTPFLSTGIKATGSIVIVCPGGGYSHLANHEGAPVAQWLNTLGIKAFVLKYRLGVDGYRHPAMLQDAQRAIRYVRSHAKDLEVDPNRVGILGFSAGGHLASAAGNHFDNGDPAAADPIERVSSRPDLMILVYPVITMGEFGHAGSRDNLLGKAPAPDLVELTSNERHVTPETPTAFLVHGISDTAVPAQNSMAFAEGLTKAGVAFELHIFGKGPKHGFGLGQSDPVVSIWPKLCEQWLRTNGF